MAARSIVYFWARLGHAWGVVYPSAPWRKDNWRITRIWQNELTQKHLSRALRKLRKAGLIA